MHGLRNCNFQGMDVPDAHTSSWASLGLRGIGLIAYAVGMLFVAPRDPGTGMWLLLPLLLGEALNALSFGLRLLPRADEAAAPLAEGTLALLATFAVVTLADAGGTTLVGFVAAVALANGVFQLASLRKLPTAVDPRRRRMLFGFAMVPLGSGMLLLAHPLALAGAVPAAALAFAALGWGLYELRLGAAWRHAKRRAIRAARIAQGNAAGAPEAGTRAAGSTPPQPAVG